MENNTGVSNDSEPIGLNRRRMLKLVGGTAVGLGITGSASGRVYQFSGCTEVCSDTDRDLAVVAVDGGYECREITQGSPQGDASWDWETYCYQAADDEVIVGMLKEDVWVGEEKTADGTCRLCTNPNDCASDHYGSVSALVDALNESSSCDACEGNVVADDECTSPGTGETTDGSSGGSDGGDDGSDSTDGGGSDGEDDGSDSTDGGGSTGDGSNDGDSTDDDYDPHPIVDIDDDDDEQDSAEETTGDDSTNSEDTLFSGGDDKPSGEQGDDAGDDEETYTSAMDRWFGRDDTPDKPADESTNDDQDARSEAPSAMERWFSFGHTPDAPSDERN